MWSRKAFGNPQQLLLAAGGMFPWRQPHASGKGPTIVEVLCRADVRHDCGCRKRSHAGNLLKALAAFVIRGKSLNPRFVLGNQRVTIHKLAIEFGQINPSAQAQSVVQIFNNVR